MVRALEKYSLDGQSATYQWLWKNHDEIALWIATQGKGRYIVLTKAVNAAGIQTNRANVRMVWLKVAADNRRAAERHQSSTGASQRQRLRIV